MFLSSFSLRASIVVAVLLPLAEVCSAQTVPCPVGIHSRFQSRVIPVHISSSMPLPFRAAIVEGVNTVNRVGAGITLVVHDGSNCSASAHSVVMLWHYDDLSPDGPVATTNTVSITGPKTNYKKSLIVSSITLNANFDFKWCRADTCYRLDGVQWTPLLQSDPPMFEITNIILHELLHGLGLGSVRRKHSRRKTDILFPTTALNAAPKTLSKYDKACIFFAAQR